jgi:hypothetical protein
MTAVQSARKFTSFTRVVHSGSVAMTIWWKCTRSVAPASAALMLGLLASPVAAQVVKAVTQDGRFVVLQPNGTWRYMEEAKANSPTIARPLGATVLLAGRQVPYGVWLDLARWRVVDPKQNQAAEYEFTHLGGQAGAIVIPDANRINPDSWKEIVITNARGAAPDARITKEERKTVNGVPVLVLQWEGTGSLGPFIHYGYYYSGSRGAVQIVTYTFAATFEQYRADLTAFLDGFVVLEQ